MLICGKFVVMRVASEIRRSSQPWMNKESSREHHEMKAIYFKLFLRLFLITFKEFKFERSKPPRKLFFGKFPLAWGCRAFLAKISRNRDSTLSKSHKNSFEQFGKNSRTVFDFSWTRQLNEALKVAKTWNVLRWPHLKSLEKKSRSSVNKVCGKR